MKTKSNAHSSLLSRLNFRLESKSAALLPRVKTINATQNPSQHVQMAVYLLLVICITFFSSCEKYLQVDPPKTQLAAQTVFESDATSKAVLSTIYARAAEFAGGGTGSVTNTGAYLADETNSYATALANAQLASNQLIASNTHTTSLWANLYTIIYQSNVLIEGITGNPKISPTVAARLTGEALFLRAYAHLTLTSYYGAVPIITSSDYRINASLARSPITAVYPQIITDLKQAKSLLAEDYLAYANERIGTTKWAASALLARAYLYSGDYAAAKSESASIIASHLFSLSLLTDVFLKNSSESILQFKPATGLQATPEGNLFILTGKPTLLALSNRFLSGFETGDLRKTSWTNKITATGVDYAFPFKYKQKGTATLNEYSVVLRLAETYLIRAEAFARLGENAAALTDLDALRTRANLPKLSLTSPNLAGAALLDAVLQERRSELFTEWNHRWVDLQRFGKAVQVLPLVKPDWKATAQLLPIPDADMRTNNNLVQNPGY